MEWPEIQKRLLAAAAMLKEHKAVGIGIKSSLALIPVVGGFVSEYWDRLDAHGEAQASELAAVLTKLATQEDLFERVAERLESQGNQLLEIKLSISQIVSDIETIADDTQYTRRMLEHWDNALRFSPARDGMTLGLAMVEDAQGGSGGGAGRVPPARPRYLVGQCPESVAVGKPFSLLASINVAASPASAELELFDVPSEGQDVDLVMYAPGLHVLSDDQQTVHVPADADSRPVRFELRADTPGPAKVSITAWIGGTHLGELRVEITAERDRAPGPHREVLAEITTQPTAGAVSLVVRYDPSQQAYRFEFRDEDNPNEVPSNLAYDPGPVVEQLIADLDSLAEGRSGYSADQTRDYLVNAGARLWQQLVPGQLREQFWDRQHRIRQLTILADKDAVPWELLYPMDPGHDAGFLVEQFPVTRAIFGWRPGRTLRLQPARFVLPEGSLQEAAAEVEAMRRLLDPGQAPGAVISELTPLTDLIGSGKFGLLHFACHNTLRAGWRLLHQARPRAVHSHAARGGRDPEGAPGLGADRVHQRVPQRRTRRDLQPARWLGQQVPRSRGGRVHRIPVGGVRWRLPRIRRGTLPPPAARIHPRGRRDEGPPGGGQHAG